MPIHDYRCLDCGQRFEAVVRSGQVLETCGRYCLPGPGVKQYGGGRVERVLSVPAAVKQPSRGGRKGKESDAGLAAKGFTKYVNEGGGRFRKVAGKGPKVIHRDAPPKQKRRKA